MPVKKRISSITDLDYGGVTHKAEGIVKPNSYYVRSHNFNLLIIKIMARYL